MIGVVPTGARGTTFGATGKPITKDKIIIRSIEYEFLLLGFPSISGPRPCELIILYGLHATSDGSTHVRRC